MAIMDPAGKKADRRADRAIQRIVELLTPEQRVKWRELVGAPFLHDLPPLRN